MTTSPAVRDTQQHYVDGFSARHQGAAPPWLHRLRHRAIDRFAELGFPSSRLEEWRYTDISRIARKPLEHADATAATKLQELDALSLPELGGDRLVFIDGHYAEALSRRGVASGAARVQLLSELTAAADSAESAEGPLAHFNQLAPTEEEAFAALNSALAEDGAVISIGKQQCMTEPLQLVFVSSADETEPHASQPRVLIVAQPGSEATVLQSHVSLGTGASFTNAVSEVVVQEGATLRLVMVQHESSASSHIATQRATVARNGRLLAHTFNLGGALVRNDLSIELADNGAECVLEGLYLGAQNQVIDNHTLVDHAAPHCSSQELYKGVLGGEARGVFRGRIVVRPGAIGTSAEQQNRNLLLTRRAEADSKPQLEIYNDDVKCSHGSSIGQLDRDALFFLRSRGLGEARARTLLAEGYATEIVESLPPGATQEWLRSLVQSRLPEIFADGELQ